MSFVLKYLTVLALVAFGFLGGMLFVKRNHVPKEALELCSQDYSNLANENNQCAEEREDLKQRFIQCVIYVNGVLEGRKGVKK